MTTLEHHDVELLIEHARADYAEYLDAAESAVTPRRSRRRANHLAKGAAQRAVEAMGDIPQLADELEHQTADAESLHRHMERAIRAEWAYKRERDAAILRAERAELVVARLTAELDQVRAALADAAADRPVTS
jgi:hypothetical protein